jgi:hypothetical protein
MSEYISVLLALLQPPVGEMGPSLLWVAVQFHRSDEDAFYTDPDKFLPLHCRGMAIVESRELFEVHLNERMSP